MAIKASERQPKRAPLNMRTTQVLRDRLADEAAKNDRSLAQEVEARLEASFLMADIRTVVREEVERARTVSAHRDLITAEQIIATQRKMGFINPVEGIKTADKAA